MIRQLAVVILAAGQGKRMRSALPKVLHPLLGRPMISYVLDVAKELFPERLIVVVGHEKERVKEAVGEGVTFVDQGEPLGTAHAVMAAEPALQGFEGQVMILCGDCPLLRPQTLRSLLQRHRDERADLTLLTAHLDDPTGYGRILRGVMGRIKGIVEESDAKGKELQIKEVNSGVYVVEAPSLFSALKEVDRSNVQGEFYLTDIVALFHSQRRKITSFLTPYPEEIWGVNTRADLAQVQQRILERILQGWMLSGVTIEDPKSTFIEPHVQIGRDTVIRPFSFLRGRTSIGEGCLIGPHVEIVDSKIGDGAQVRFCSLVVESELGEGVTVGPFSHLRPGTCLREGVRIGNFVEVKKARIGPGTKANHLAYIGDAQVGEGVNIGAGTITCNYDGFKKHLTVIGDGAFVGSNTALVAPVTVGKGAVIGAGSVITKDVPSEALAVGRAKQKTIKRWVIKREKKRAKRGAD